MSATRCAEEKRQEPCKNTHYRKGKLHTHKVRPEFAYTCTCVVNYNRNKSIIHNVPGGSNKVHNRADGKVDIYNVPYITLGKAVDIKGV